MDCSESSSDVQCSTSTSEINNTSSNGSVTKSLSDDATIYDKDIFMEEPFQDDPIGNILGSEDDTSGRLYESSELSVNQTLAMLFTWFCSSPKKLSANFCTCYIILCFQERICSLNHIHRLEVPLVMLL